jgi:hypothetical protein
MKITLVDKDFRKVSSFELKQEEIERLEDKSIVSSVFSRAVNALLQAGIKKEDIRVIEWDSRRLWNIEDFKLEEVL